MPLAPSALLGVERLADADRASRNLRWLEICLGGQGRIEAALADDLFDEADRDAINLKATTGKGSSFRARAAYLARDARAECIAARLKTVQADIDRFVKEIAGLDGSP